MKVTIISPVKHDGKRFAPGDSVDLPTEVAKTLITSGSAEQESKAKPKNSADDKGPVADPASPASPAQD
ncbi:DUF7210 family protein [Noviherbaspirillum sp. Root189]|uniref:DUF7210 family protein n=1 Tax=Noviherbaspirillum sp. Root189 TaxID=1736487 RepID=UPI00070E93D5|nr:hypothetical protein [Noviherbaspirillum sp. Root189]KRB73446.1 hypothetical protein ASE07_06230 [Noviherbaspirillum sp. Root189]